MPPLISVVIPVRNGRHTIGRCLEAAFASDFEDFEVVVCDDGSTDDTAAIVAGFPKAKLLRRPHGGAAAARNAGAAAATGEILFFIDADCLLEPDAVQNAARAMAGVDPRTVVGGTYAARPGENFFGKFQSAFIHHSETKHSGAPDYIASHALVIRNATFRATGGFPERFMPIIEDVEYAHRLRKTGHRLVMDQTILVRHVFLFTAWRSLRNAFKKSRFWTRYSLHNKDVFTDSGTASFELKTATAVLGLSLLLLLGFATVGGQVWLWPLPVLWLMNLVVSRRLLAAFWRADGIGLFLPATLYLLTCYPLPVGLGAVVGILEYPKKGVL